MTSFVSGGRAARAPWHLWLVGGLGLLWNGYGAYDYLMTNLRGEPYLRSMGFTGAQLAYFGAMPGWMTAVWATGVWGAFLGTLLLLLRRKWAFPAFALSFLAVLISLAYGYLLSNGAEVMGPTYTVMNLVIVAGAAFFVWYSRRMANRGVLR